MHVWYRDGSSCDVELRLANRTTKKGYGYVLAECGDELYDFLSHVWHRRPHKALLREYPDGQYALVAVYGAYEGEYLLVVELNSDEKIIWSEICK